MGGNNKTIEELLTDYLAFSSRNDPRETAAFNKVKELLGEEFADIAMDHKFGRQVQAARGVLNRGTKPGRPGKGPPIFDRVYELGDDRFLLAGEDELAVVDAKFGESELARVNRNRVFLVSPEGQMIRLPQKRQARQLDVDWVRDRIRELAAAEEKNAGSTGVATDSLAARLKRAAGQGKLQVYEIRTTLEFGEDHIPDVHIEIVDHSVSFRDAYLSGRRVPRDVEAVAALKESIANYYLTQSDLKARVDASAYETIKRQLRRAKTKVRKAKRQLAEAPTPATRAHKRQILEERKGVADDLEAQAKRAKKQAAKSEKATNFNKELRDAQTKQREAEEAKKRRAARAAKQADTEAGQSVDRANTDTAAQDTATGDTAVSQAATDTAQTDVASAGAVSDEARGISGVIGDRGVSGVATADKMTDAALQADRAARTVVGKGLSEVAVRQAAHIAEESGGRALTRMALAGGRVVMRVGKFAFELLDIVTPILDLLLVKDGVDLLVNWLQRAKIEEQQEWRRIAHYLSAQTQHVRLPPFGVDYTTSREATISVYVQNILSGEIPGRQDDFITWYTKWHVDTGWSGFVYTTVRINLERQKVPDDDYPYQYTYWFTDLLDLTLSADPPPNSKTEKYVGLRGPGEEANRITQGRSVVYDPDYNISVEVSELQICYSYLTPTLTPFDFIRVKCNSLISDIVAFVSRYDTNVSRWMDVRSEIAPRMTYVWFENYTSSNIDAEGVKWCLKTLLWVGDQLAQHVPKKGDSVIPKYTGSLTLNRGYHRRLQILFQLSRGGPNGSLFTQIGNRLYGILANDHSAALVRPIDKDLEYLTPQYLSKVADEIDAELKRTLKACQNPPTDVEYNYQGPPPPQRPGR